MILVNPSPRTGYNRPRKVPVTTIGTACPDTRHRCGFTSKTDLSVAGAGFRKVWIDMIPVDQQ